MGPFPRACHIYGATPNNDCYVTIEKENNSITTQSKAIKDYVFKNLSSISSDPKSICLCNSSSQLQCTNLSYIFYSTSRYPGEEFSLSLAVVGFEFGRVTGPVYANLLPQANNSKSSLNSNQHLRQIGKEECTRLSFAIHSLTNKETIVLTTNPANITTPENEIFISAAITLYDEIHHPIPYILLTAPVYINVTLLDCPPGFQLNTDTGRCDCDAALQEIGINNCSIHDNSSFFTRSGDQWLQQVSSNDIVSSKYCPFNYCRQGPVNMNLSDPYEQCVLNHTGILCGACPPMLSLAIGSSRCLHCPDNYDTLLLIAFAAAGIVVVLCINIFDVTVTTGTINGLILYANITWGHKSILFPNPTQTSSLLNFLKVFIAWLNLELGIETCFIKGLDGYWKTWLQFAFPAYIWLIAGLIILVLHYSIRATKIFGNNSVSVLATLFLISYAKLMHTIMTVLKYTVLEYPNGQRTVWSFDGNILYFSTEHSILFVVALAILLILWLPNTFVLLFIQCLRKHSHYWLLRWINKWNPLFDSFLGPLKVKHHYWIGLGFLARLAIHCSSEFTENRFIAALMITLIAFLLGLLVLSVYRQWQLGVLEACFLVNLAMLSSGVLLIEAQRDSKDALGCISLGITFILFLAILGYHVWNKLCLLRKQCKNKGYVDIDNNSIKMDPESQSPSQTTTYQRISVQGIRESILTSTT